MTKGTKTPGYSTGRVLLGAIAGAVALLSVAQLAAQAQTYEQPEPLEDLRTKDGADFFNGRSNGNSSVMNFIQNAIIGVPRDPGEFAAEQKENFDDATAKFRQRQAEQFKKLQQPGPEATPGEVAPLPTGGN